MSKNVEKVTELLYFVVVNQAGMLYNVSGYANNYPSGGFDIYV